MRPSFVQGFVALVAIQVVFAAPAPQSVSKTSRCGPSYGLTCSGSSFGDCCSHASYCGSTSDYCDKKKGCQAGWGKCDLTSPSFSASPKPAAGPKVSEDGQCGKNSGASCTGSKFGDCCR
ncbi:hypothetical protein CC86DRAFT_419442 [Ophiobolus disseminans]|uniref:Chitin-binding type-1 domain-containing protein n=1 Tax=Ophiobolus disseminans TaxID=1469910 RepID=A0A6A6ZYD0_9PLEO|nr:hypothetical protein CC86DRAFT_419442 [Ophiobolus disseminans]